MQAKTIIQHVPKMINRDSCFKFMQNNSKKTVIMMKETTKKHKLTPTNDMRC